MNVVYCKSNCEYSKNGICTSMVIQVGIHVGKATGKKKAICENYKEKAAHESD